MVIHENSCIQKVNGRLLNLYSTSSASTPPPLRPSESLTTGLFLAALDGGLAQCVGEAGPVGMSWCSLSYTVRWTPGHPILIRFAAAAICPSSVINPSCYLAPTGCTVNTVCVCVFHTSLLQRHSFKDLLRHQNVFGINITGNFGDFLDFLQDALT